MFQFKQFTLRDGRCAMKIGTDGVLLGAWASPVRPADGPLRILDVGAGSALVGLMMLQRFQTATVQAVEIDPEACKDASENAQASPFADRITIVNDDFSHFALQPQDGSFDMIVSNPPFFSTGLRAPHGSRATARHQGALNYESLIRHASRALTKSGVLAMVTPADAENSLTETAEFAGMKVRRLCRVSTRAGRGPNRLLWALSPTDGPCATTQLTIRDNDNNYTDEYRQLTKDFYLHF